MRLATLYNAYKYLSFCISELHTQNRGGKDAKEDTYTHNILEGMKQSDVFYCSILGCWFLVWKSKRACG